MVTAASTADLAIILIDARKGVLTQTRRHSYLAHLLGIPHLVVAVNKMDLVGLRPKPSRAFASNTWRSPATGHNRRALHSDVGPERRHAGRSRRESRTGTTGRRCSTSSNRRRPRTAKARPLPLPGAVRLPPAGGRQPPAARLSRLHGPRRIRRTAVGDAVVVLPSGTAKPRQGHPGARRIATARCRRAVGDPAARRRDRHLARRHDRQDRRIAAGHQTDRRHALLAVGVAARPAPQVPASPYHARHQGDARRHRLSASTSTPWNGRRPSGC
jgi:hypothetical protein